MLKKRVIPLLLVRDGFLVRSQAFSLHQIVGCPKYQIGRYNEWSLDELIVLDISYHSDLSDEGLELLKQIAPITSMPLSFGGGIRHIKQVEDRIRHGAEKVVINTKALEDPKFINEGARLFGSQAMVVCVDIKKDNSDGRYKVATKGGTKVTQLCPIEWAKELQDRGAGEILLQFVDLDGAQKGYDIGYASDIVSQIDIPIILCGGAGHSQHLQEGLSVGHAVAAANLFLYTELSYSKIKDEITMPNERKEERGLVDVL